MTFEEDFPSKYLIEFWKDGLTVLCPEMDKRFISKKRVSDALNEEACGVCFVRLKKELKL